MSVKYALLALLSRADAGAYQLRKDFEAVTSQTWPLNAGQVSTTLGRLERDHLIVPVEVPADAGVATMWHLTDEGRQALASWLSAPVPRREPGREELAIKLAVAVAVPGVDVAAIVQGQRQATQQALHDVTRARRHASEDLAAGLVLDHHVFTLEAELRWLDDVEGRLERAAASRADRSQTPGSARAAAPRVQAPLAQASTGSKGRRA